MLFDHFNHFKEGAILKRGEPHLDETRCEEFLIKKVFHLTHLKNQGNIKKTREAVTPRLDTVKLCASKYYTERSQGQCKKWLRKSDLNNF